MHIILAQTLYEDLTNLSNWFFAGAGGLIGTIFGIIFTIWSYNKKKKESVSTALKALSASLKFNNERLEQIIGSLEFILERKKFPDYALDDLVLALRTAKMYGDIDSEILKEIEWHRYQLNHINQKLSSISHRQKIEGKIQVEQEELLGLLSHAKVALEGGYKWHGVIEKERKGF